MTRHSDKDILQLFQQERKEEYAFNLLVTKYQRRLYWHIRKLVISHEDTDDILQNTFIKVWKNLKDFKGESSLFTWLFRIATNESLSFLRKKNKNRSLNVEFENNELAEKLKADPDFNGRLIQRKLQEAILRLPEKQRIVFNMKYFDGFKYEDMSSILDTSVGALKASYHHAVKKIEQFLNEG